MEAFELMVQRYRRRNKTTLIDSITAGLSHADEVSIDLGVLSETGLLKDLLSAVSLCLPFVIVAVTESGNVLLRKKSSKAFIQDTSYRMLKTGAAMGLGTAMISAGLAPAAIPVTISARVLMDRYRSRFLTAKRVERRIERLQEIRAQRASTFNLGEKSQTERLEPLSS